jgi:hypothetical protein
MAKICGISKASLQRVWHANGLKPHLLKTFKLSNDPQFIEKLEDVVGVLIGFIVVSQMGRQRGGGAFMIAPPSEGRSWWLCRQSSLM